MLVVVGGLLPWVGYHAVKHLRGHKKETPKPEKYPSTERENLTTV
jgi:hypothetical protein